MGSKVKQKIYKNRNNNFKIDIKIYKRKIQAIYYPSNN